MIVLPEAIERGKSIGPELRRAVVVSRVSRGRPEGERQQAVTDAEELAAGLQAAAAVNTGLAATIAALRVNVEHPDLRAPGAARSDEVRRDVQDPILAVAAGLEEAVAAFRAADFEATAVKVWPVAPTTADRLRAAVRRWDEAARALGEELEAILEALDDLIDIHGAREADAEGGEPIPHEEVRRMLGLGP
jgi:hypothetical protein